MEHSIAVMNLKYWHFQTIFDSLLLHFYLFSLRNQTRETNQIKRAVVVWTLWTISGNNGCAV